MRARLLVPFGRTVEHGPLEVHAWPADRSIPSGWEEIELAPPMSLPRDLCECGDPRQEHIRHREACLRDDCRCVKFRENE